jgi:hypothetical protein
MHNGLRAWGYVGETRCLLHLDVVYGALSAIFVDVHFDHPPRSNAHIFVLSFA